MRSTGFVYDMLKLAASQCGMRTLSTVRHLGDALYSTSYFAVDSHCNVSFALSVTQHYFACKSQRTVTCDTESFTPQECLQDVPL